MSIDYIKRAEENMRRMQEDSNIDRAVDHYVKVAKTQAGIIEMIKKMADVMAEAAIASQKALGDSTDVAIMKWTRILADEARKLAKEKKDAASKEIESGIVIDQEKT